MTLWCWISTAVFVVCVGRTAAQDDFSGPISCFYCFGPADNSTCADPVDVRRDRESKALTVIKCETGVCLKWAHYWNNVLYMHRTCSANLTKFKIMMVDGVCRTESTGNGYLCMCGKHLCNHGYRLAATPTGVLLTGFSLLYILFMVLPS